MASIGGFNGKNKCYSANESGVDIRKKQYESDEYDIDSNTVKKKIKKRSVYSEGYYKLFVSALEKVFNRRKKTIFHIMIMKIMKKSKRKIYSVKIMYRLMKRRIYFYKIKLFHRCNILII